MREVENKKYHIIGKFANKYWKTSQKFAIRLPKKVVKALQIDKETGTDFWMRSIEKEMLNV